MLKVVQKNIEANDEAAVAAGGSLLDEMVRDGAQQILATALQAEVAAYVEAFATSSTSTVDGWWFATATTPPTR